METENDDSHTKTEHPGEGESCNAKAQEYSEKTENTYPKESNGNVGKMEFLAHKYALLLNRFPYFITSG